MDLGQVVDRHGFGNVRHATREGGHRQTLQQVAGDLLERVAGDHLEVGHQRGLGRVAGRHEQPADAAAGKSAGCHQDAVDVAHGTVERQLTQERRLGRRRCTGLVEADRNSDGEVEAATVLASFGGRQVDGHAGALGRPRQSGVADCGTDALPGFANGPSGQADHEKTGLPGGDVDLDVDRQDVEAAEQHRAHGGGHARILGRRGRPRERRLLRDGQRVAAAG